MGDPLVGLGLVAPAARAASGAVKPGSARLPVSSSRRGSPSRSSISAALGRRPLVVPEDRGTEHALGLVEGDETVHLAGEADAGDPVDAPGLSSASSAARRQSSGSCSAQPGLGVASG